MAPKALIKQPYLVQRLLLRERTDKDKGVDGYFSMDYMGSAEFEFGALPNALKRMRQAQLVGPRCIKVKKKEVWYVGPKDYLAVAENFFEDQLRPMEMRQTLKGISYLATVFGVEDVFVTTVPGLVGWWDIVNDWVIFTTKEYATNWRSGLKNKPQKEKDNAPDDR